MSKSNFSTLPSVTITRSKFNRKSQHKTSLMLGELTPIYLDEVLPGDTRKIDIGSLIRMSTPVFPVMDNIYIDLYAFFVPNRLTWEHWKEFMGENNSSAGIYTGTKYRIPKLDLFGYSHVRGRLGDHFGLPLTPTVDATKHCFVSTLPFRAYRLIYNRFFRDQNVIAPITVNRGDTANSYDNPNQYLQKVAKVSDYFTRSLPYAQKGAPVSIPLGTTAPIIAENITDPSNLHDLGNSLQLGRSNAGVAEFIGRGYLSGGTSKGFVHGTDTFDQYDLMNSAISKTNLSVDLSQATAATINTLRFAFQYQKLLEKDALYGTRYWEIIKAHFGVTAPDASLQDPELLGHRKIWVNVDQVVQTTGVNQSTPASNSLGATAAVSVTGDAGNICSKSFTEHGFIMVLACARHDQTYGQGVERMWSRSVREDFYFPVFANLGAQEVKKREIYMDGSSTDDEAFGFQEAWAEYRYKPSKVTGLLNPSQTGSLGYMTLANNFGSRPTLGQTFIEQDRDALSRVLQTGASGPDFVCDFAFQDVAVRPMPLYSIPGLIDHH